MFIKVVGENPRTGILSLTHLSFAVQRLYILASDRGMSHDIGKNPEKPLNSHHFNGIGW